jgi:hypothetical protein
MNQSGTSRAVNSGASAPSKGVRLLATTDSLFYRLATIALAFGLAVFVWNAVTGPRVDILFLLIVAPPTVYVVDFTATRSQNRWLHGPAASAQASADGLEAPLRRDSEFAEHDGSLELRSAVLRRRLGGFEHPNRLPWSSKVLMRILPSSRKPYDAMIVFVVWGPTPIMGGPRSLFGSIRLWASHPDLLPLIRMAAGGSAHIHVHPSLLSGARTELRRCPDDPSGDPSISGTCLDKLTGEAMAELLRPGSAS